MRIVTHRFLSLLIVFNYVAFRVELFKDEEAQNRPQPCAGVSYSFPTLNWETFDKDNAPKAFTFTSVVHVEVFGLIPQHIPDRVVFLPPFRLIHDKSPPGPLETT